MSDYPRMLYRKGSEERVWGKYDCDTMIARDGAEHETAQAEGWEISPQAAHGEEGDAPASRSPREDAELDELRAYKKDADEMIAAYDAETKKLQAEVAAAYTERDALRAENEDLKAKLAAFDRDGDGKPGGSKKKEG